MTGGDYQQELRHQAPDAPRIPKSLPPLALIAAHQASPKIVSLFSGAGGLDLGFKEAGFSISVAFDSEDSAIRTHRKNFPETNVILADLIDVQPKGMLEHVKVPEFPVLSNFCPYQIRWNWS